MATNTKNRILETFGAMLDRMPFEKITVTALIKECGIGRNTFYYHYEDIYDLLDDWLARCLGWDGVDACRDWKDNLKHLLFQCRANKNKVYHVFNSISRDRMERYALTSNTDLIEKYVAGIAGGRNVSADKLKAITDLFRWTIIGFFLRYLWNDMKDDVDKAVDDFAPLVETFIGSALTAKRQ